MNSGFGQITPGLTFENSPSQLTIVVLLEAELRYIRAKWCCWQFHMVITSEQNQDLCRFLKDRLGFEVVAFLQAGLLAFNPVGSFLYHSLQFVGVANEEAVRITLFAGGCCLPRATHREVEVFEATGGLAFPDGCGDGSVADGFYWGGCGFLFCFFHC
jgi:hypothetical protein